MNQWSRTRKRIILSIVILSVFVLIGLPVFFLFYQAPSCSDGKQSGDETGVDCGGSCQLLCPAESLPLLLKGDPRVLALASRTYQVVALVENPNNDAEVYRAGYILKLYDASSTIPLKVIEGEAYAPQGATFAIFEGPFALQAGISPKRATLEWRKDSLNWRKNTKPAPELEVKGLNLSRLETNPRLDAMVLNRSLERAANIDLVALLSDAQGNIFAASKTFIETLAPGAETGAVFTWPRPFGQEAVDIDIIVRLFPDRSFIR